MSAKDQTIAKVNLVLDMAEKRVNECLAAKVKASVTKLSEDIAEQTNTTFTFAYGVISDYLASRTDCRVARGRNGGIMPPKPVKQEEEKAEEKQEPVSGPVAVAA